MAKYSFQIGQKFGSWTVMADKPTGKPLKIECKCDCGAIRQVNIYTLIKGRSKNCGCNKIGDKSKNFTGTSTISGSTIYRAVNYANTFNNRHPEILNSPSQTESISSDYLKKIYNIQHGQCSVTSMPLNNDNSALTRIDCNSGYVPGNVTWVNSNWATTTNNIGASVVASQTSNPLPNIFEQLGFKKNV